MRVYVGNKFSPLMLDGPTHALPFAFDRRWTFTSRAEEADIVPLLAQHSEDERKEQHSYFSKLFPQNTKVVVMSLFHDSEEESTQRWDSYFDYFENCKVLTTIYNHPSPKYIFYDFLWNRTKAYYSKGYGYQRWLESSVWTRDFNLNIFQLNISKNIKYNILCPNRAYYNQLETVNRLDYRSRLHQAKNQNKWNNVLVSDPDNGIIFKTDNWQQKYSKVIESGGNYAPIACSYYNESFLSAYVESIATWGHNTNVMKSITEKTWEPLLKGHFILPFAAPGIIQELKRRGFRFPDFINYDYADITDDEMRWAHFMIQFEKIQRLNINQLNTLYNDNIDIIEHNRSLFDTIPYDSLYDKLK